MEHRYSYLPPKTVTDGVNQPHHRYDPNRWNSAAVARNLGPRFVSSFTNSNRPRGTARGALRKSMAPIPTAKHHTSACEYARLTDFGAAPVRSVKLQGFFKPGVMIPAGIRRAISAGASHVTEKVSVLENAVALSKSQTLVPATAFPGPDLQEREQPLC